MRKPEGFYAIFAKCTHLGCTPRWLAAENKFKCPCHGSGYYKSGVNFEGPAPRPMDRVRITRAEDGQIVVDMSVKYRFGAHGTSPARSCKSESASEGAGVGTEYGNVG